MVNVNILLVEDESIEAMDIKRTVESLGYKIPYIASNGEDAISKALEIIPDLILMDISIKGEMDGIEVTKQIKTLDIPVIYLTAHSEEATFQRALETEPDGYVLKPFDPMELKFTIEMALYKEKMDKKLKESQNQFRLLTETIDDVIYVIDLKKQKIIYISPAVEKITGYEKESFYENSDQWMEIMLPEDRSKVLSFISQMNNEDKKKKIEYRIQTRDGGEKWLSEVFKILTDENGKPLQVVGHATDITLEKESKKRLENSEKNYRNLVDSSMVGIFRSNLNGDILFANEAMAKMFHYDSVEEMKTINVLNLYKNPDERKLLIEKLKKDGFITNCEANVVGKNGELINILLSINLNDEIFSGMFMDITELKLTEKKLAKSESRYRTIFENSGNLMLTFDDEGTIIMFNSEWERVSGYSRQEVEGRKWMEFVHPDYLETMIEYHHQRMINPNTAPNKYETVFISKNKKPLTMYVTVTTIPETEKWLVAAIDITEMKKTEKAMRESEEKYKAMMDYSSDAILLADLEGNFTECNKRAEELFGYSQDQILKLNVKDIHPSEELERVQKVFKMVPTQDMGVFNTLILTSDNRKVSVDIKGSLIEYGGKKVLQGIFRDVTERKEAEKALLESEERYKTLFESDPNYTILIAPDGVLLDVNEAAEKVTGLSKEELVGKSFSKIGIFPESELELHGEMFAHTLKHGTVEPYNARIIDKKGKIRMVLNQLTAIKKNDKLNYVLVIGRDITEHEKAQNALKESLTEKKILLREIHHRVKNNMQIISSLLNLQIQFEDQDKTVSVLKESQGRVKSMAMVHEKLYQSDTLSKINFKDYVTNMVSDIFYSYGINKETINPELDIEDVNLNIDTAIPLGLIINELTTNSVKYAFPQSEGTLKIKLKTLPEQMELIVADDGVGIPEDLDIKKTETLGLQLVNNLINQIDGEIELDRRNGTKFKIIFKELEYKKRF
jgi:PAS domain S-box-containing protein